ncbi:MAG: large conductance mechanosensitive channel protein MscL, partial [Saprospiraceae bacterium]|nr:large conductance mechanosensitive channel protein MscL [Saprospiraceae bacterium]
IAVAFVMGAAFGAVVTSFTEGIVSPLIGLVFQADFNSLKYVIQAGVPDANGAITGEIAVLYGKFITAVINFIIVAFIMFLLVKGINKLKKKEAEAPVEAPAPSAQEVLLAEIRDLLRK